MPTATKKPNLETLRADLAEATKRCNEIREQVKVLDRISHYARIGTSDPPLEVPMRELAELRRNEDQIRGDFDLVIIDVREIQARIRDAETAEREAAREAARQRVRKLVPKLAENLKDAGKVVGEIRAAGCSDVHGLQSMVQDGAEFPWILLLNTSSPDSMLSQWLARMRRERLL